MFNSTVTACAASMFSSWNPSEASSESAEETKKAFVSAKSGGLPRVDQAAQSHFQRQSSPLASQGFTTGSGVRQINDDNLFAKVANALKIQEQENARLPKDESQMHTAQTIAGLMELIPEQAHERVYRRDVSKPQEAAEFLEEVLRRLENQINLCKVTPQILKSLLGFFTKHKPDPILLRSYTCLMRLLPELSKYIVDANYQTYILKKIHPCLEVGLSTQQKRLTEEQFLDVCSGLEVYTNLQNSELALNIFGIFAKQILLLPRLSNKLSPERILVPLLFLENLKNLNAEQTAENGNFVEQIKDIERRKNFAGMVDDVARTLVNKVPGLSGKNQSESCHLLDFCLTRLGYNKDFINSFAPLQLENAVKVVFTDENFSEKVNLLSGQLTRNTFCQESWEEFLNFLKKHVPQPKFLRTYARLMRLWGSSLDLKEMKKGDYASHVWQIHRCLSVSLQRADLQISEFADVCQGLKAYKLLQLREQLGEILSMLSEKAKRLPAIDKMSSNSLYSLLKQLCSFRLSYPIEVQNIVKDLVAKINFSNRNGLFSAELSQFLQKNGYHQKQIQEIMGENYPRVSYMEPKNPQISNQNDDEDDEDFIDNCAPLPIERFTKEAFTDANLSEKINLLPSQITRRMFDQEDWKEFLVFFEKHAPQPKNIKIYARLIRLWGSSLDLEEMKKGDYASHVWQIHRCLSLSLQGTDLQISEFADVCQGLEAYKLLQKEEPLREILNMLSEKAKRLPTIEKMSHHTLCLMLRRLSSIKPSHSDEVINVIKNLIGKINFSIRDALFPAKLSQIFQKKGYSQKQIQEMMGENYPNALYYQPTTSQVNNQNDDEGENDGQGRVVRAAQWSNVPQSLYSAWGQAHGASWPAWGGPQNSFGSTPRRW